jgi:hypothetical protein
MLRWLLSDCQNCFCFCFFISFLHYILPSKQYNCFVCFVSFIRPIWFEFFVIIILSRIFTQIRGSLLLVCECYFLTFCANCFSDAIVAEIPIWQHCLVTACCSFSDWKMCSKGERIISKRRSVKLSLERYFRVILVTLKQLCQRDKFSFFHWFIYGLMMYITKKLKCVSCFFFVHRFSSLVSLI